MTIVSAKRTSRRPSAATWSVSIAALDRATRSGSMRSVIANTALRSGSSQHGKARRASVASNCVVAMTCSAPASSVKVER